MILESHQIKARKVHFDFSESSVCWMKNDPLCSHVANGINMLLPAGEFWFCRVFDKTIPLITDEKLKEDVIGFIRQKLLMLALMKMYKIFYGRMATTFKIN